MAVGFLVSRRYRSAPRPIRAGKRIPSSNAIVLSHNERLKAAKKLANRYISFFGSGPVSRLVFKKRVKQINDAVRAVAMKKLRRSPAMLAKFSLDTPRSNERFAMYAAQRRRLSSPSSIRALEEARNVANDAFGVRFRGVPELARQFVTMKMKMY